MSGQEQVDLAAKKVSKRRRQKRLSIWQIIANVFKEAGEKGKKVNRNNVYAQHGISTGNPEFHPRRGKFKGYMRG